MTASDKLLSTPEALAYWEERHRRLDALRSGGNAGLDATTNEILYHVRLGRLLEIIGFASDATAPLDVLDAGCGKGYFARSLARCGHRVQGIDASTAAIEECLALGGGPDYAVCLLSAWHPPHLYDVVYAVDVLFHLVDDGDWGESVHTLAVHVRLGGALVITDLELGSRREFGDYQVARSLSEYVAVLESCGLHHERSVPDGFRSSGVQFHVFRREA